MKISNTELRSDLFNQAWQEYCNSHFGKQFSKLLNVEVFKSTITLKSSRVLNHWEKVDLLTSNHTASKTRRKYSVMDIVWISIISELRNFGISLENIQLVKKSLTKVKSIVKYSQLPLLEYYVAMQLVHARSSLLLISEHFDVEPIFADEFLDLLNVGISYNYIILNIDRLLRKNARLDVNAIFQEGAYLTPEEMMLLDMSDGGVFKKIKIKHIDGTIETIESTEASDMKERLSHFLKTGVFQNINLVPHKGNPVTIVGKIKNPDFSNSILRKEKM